MEEQTQLLRLLAQQAQQAQHAVRDPLAQVLQALASQDWAALRLQPNEQAVWQKALQQALEALLRLPNERSGLEL